MDHSETGHGEHGETPHLPDPSVWPLVAALAGFILGAAIIYYSHDRDAQFAGPLLGAAAIITLLAGAGWAYEDGRMKRKAEQGEHSTRREARYTQVVTFAIAEGQYLASRAEGGIITLLEATDNNLRDLDGFQDMRVIVSPAEDGPSQVLVETTWADREGLATYEQTRTTMLDLLAGHGEEVVPGSVQVFDMEVVRDTKDTSFNFGTGALVGTFGALIVGGFMVGAGLNLFSSDSGGAGGGEGTPPVAGPASNVIVAQNTKFTVGSTITAPPNTEITLEFENKDTQFHNVHIFASDSTSGASLTGCTAGCPTGDVATELKGGPFKEDFTFKTPGVGEYAFHCDAHPDQMKGKLVIQDGAPVPGAAAGGSTGGDTGGGATGDTTIVAKGTKFTKNKVTAAGGAPITLTFDNQDASPPHNVEIFAGDKTSGPLLTGCTDGCDSDKVSTPIKGGPYKEKFTFTAPAPGTYAFHCVVHPVEMTGTLVVQ